MASTNEVNPSPHTENTAGGIPPTEAESNVEHTVPPWWSETGVSKEAVQAFFESKALLPLLELHQSPETDVPQGQATSEDTGYAGPPSVSTLEDLDCGSWQNAPNSKCHASFGDRGTTATVGAFGQLLQFSENLGAGSSGMFSVDHIGIPEPFFVTSRANELHGLSQEPFHFGTAKSDGQPYGLRFPGLVLKSDAEPELKWTHWRWPRHEYARGDFEDCSGLKLTIQWMVHEKTVLQQCFLEYDGQESIQVAVEFSKSMMIRDLDYLDTGLNFNEEETKNHYSRPGPEGYSWVCVHKLNTQPATEGSRTDDSVQETPIPSVRSNVPGQDGLQGFEDTVSSDASASTDEAIRDAVSTSSDAQRPRQQSDAGACEIVEDETSLDGQSNSSTRSGMEEKPQPEQSIHDREAELKASYGVSVTASVAINGKLQLFDSTNPQRWQRWTIPVDSVRTPGTHVLEVTVAYEMNLLETLETNWEAHVIPQNNMRVSEFLREQPPAQQLPLCTAPPFKESIPDTALTREDLWNNGYVQSSNDTSLPKHSKNDETTCTQTENVPLENPVGTPGKSTPQLKSGALHNYLQFAARRNLEHILSVCAVQAMPYRSHADVIFPDDLHNVRAVAFTCGDMSGHRICWSASFFAFQFLVESYKSLRGLLIAQPVLDRIMKACRGHLKWLHLVQQQNTGQHFGANYWVTGKLTDSTGGTSSGPGESLLNTGFQILKAAACMELWPDYEIAVELVSDWTPSWLLSMEKMDRRKKHAWPHAKDYGVNTFRLDDHVWIWRALKSLESRNHRIWNRMSEKAGLNPLSSADVARLRKTLGSRVVQHEASKRFTTYNDVLQKRMLAVTRSSKETRFMLHAHDTALFYSEASEFFSKDTSVKELWRSTIDCQRYHEQNGDFIWEKSMRYALCIMMCTQGLRINDKPVGELVRTATDTLISSSSPNGFFPGQLEFFMNQPLQKPFPAEKDRDSYYHASFEIPFILLTHANQVREIYKRSTAGPTNPTSRPKAGPGHGLQRSNSMQEFPQAQSDFNLFPTDTEQRPVPLHLSSHLLSRSTLPCVNHREVFGDVRRAMKKALPFNSLIDYSNVVKLEDEWLFGYPEFFMREGNLKSDDYNDALRELMGTVIAPKITSTRAVSDGHDPFHEMTSAMRRMFKIWETEPSFRTVDVPSSKLNKGERKDHKPRFDGGLDHEDLWDVLSPARTAQDAKKRLLYFHTATKEAAAVCYAATEPSERDSLQEFFERHALYEKHATDQCSMAHNTWETELHLSYYQLVEGSSDSRPGIPTAESKPFPEGCEKQVFRVSASFRFKGDFFDRYWTGYMLEYTQNGPISNPFLLRDKEYRQRKVLEQRYFADILTNLVASTSRILTEIEDSLGFKSGSFTTSIASTKAYLAWSSLWQKFEPLLQELDDDLRSTQIAVDDWGTREADRGHEKPRWTSDDEAKYRATITKMHRRIKHQTSNLQQLHATIRSLRESCSTRLVRAREELSFRSDQNIATFTYVTVVFLPLGFTASIFSMSGSPERSLVINMVVASVVALAVTILALMNAKGLAGVAENIRTRFRNITAKAKQSSLMMRDQGITENEAIESNPSDREPPRLHASSTNGSMWNLVFWTGYIFMELPSRSIAVACRILGWSRNDDKDLEGLKESKRIGPFARSAVASGIRYCLVPSMTYLEKETAAVLGRSSMEFPHEPVAQLVADHKLRKDGYAIRIARVLLGVFMVPVFLPTWILQIVCFNAWDALVLLAELTHQGIKHISLPEIDGSETSLMTHLAKPPEKLRPLKSFKNHLQPKEKPPQPEVLTKAGNEGEIAFSLKKLSQAAQ